MDSIRDREHCLLRGKHQDRFGKAEMILKSVLGYKESISQAAVMLSPNTLLIAEKSRGQDKQQKIKNPLEASLIANPST